VKKLNLFTSLNNPLFRRLYIAQTISLFGDALTWLGLALLAFELAAKSAPLVLASALTLRVTAFVLLSPIAGVVADRFDRKPILMITHLGRMCLVCLLPFVRELWQIYALVLGLNIFNAVFTPTYQATIPLVTGKTDYPQAISLSSSTYQILGVFGPGIAGVLALFIGARELFFWDGLSFFIAAILIGSLPGDLRVNVSNTKSGSYRLLSTSNILSPSPGSFASCLRLRLWLPSPKLGRGAGGEGKIDKSVGHIWSDLQTGTVRLWVDAPIRYGLMMQLVASIAGAQILVNTVGYVRGMLQQTAVEYGWVMMGFGLGATCGTIALGNYPQYRSNITTLLGGSLLIVTALLPANYVGLVPLIILWSIAGFGQSLINLSMQTLIADRTPTDIQGRVYGAHFAWSHLWWAGSYPLAGWLGNTVPGQTFLFGSLIGMVLLSIVYLALKPDRFTHTHAEFWHIHQHSHDANHLHSHLPDLETVTGEHRHPHLHTQFSHTHSYTDISHDHRY
jgi:MFS transporter, NRE family, putaive nickel resistance protein